MANQTVTTTVNYDSDAILPLLNGETIAIDGGNLTINSDVRWNQQGAVFGNITISSSLGGTLTFDGTTVWELPFSASSGNVPAQASLGSNGVTGGTSGATGELLRVWATGSLTPETAGGAMPATGWIKLRTKTGTFQNGETVTLPGGATITLSGAGKRSWLNLVGAESGTLTVPRLGNFSANGDWYELGTTNGADGQTFQYPVADECLAVQIETSPGSGTYEWWLNAGWRWHNFGAVSSGGYNWQSIANTTITLSTLGSTPINPSDPYGYFTTAVRIRETTANAAHVASTYATSSLLANTAAAGNMKLRTYLKKETRQFAFVQVQEGTTYYGAVIDLDTATLSANRTVGSPTGTSTTITNGSGTWAGWILVELTIDHALANAMNGYVGTSNSGAPSYDATGRPTFTGVATEGVYVSELQIIAPSTFQGVNSTDFRGKYFISNPTTGVLTFAQRTGGDRGLKPTSGCKVRIPNLILSSANTAEYARNTQHMTIGTRYKFSGAGSFPLDKVNLNWSMNFASMYGVSISNSAAYYIKLTSPVAPCSVTNTAIGVSRDFCVVQTLVGESCTYGFTVSDCFIASYGNSALYTNYGKNIEIARVRIDKFDHTSAAYHAQLATLSNGIGMTFTDMTIVNGGIINNSSRNVAHTNLVYCDTMVGTTTGAAQYALSSTGSSNMSLEGFSTPLTNVHPQNGISQFVACDGVEIKNIGTIASPFDGGSVNQCVCVASLSNSFNVAVRRCYTQNMNGAPVAGYGNDNISIINVWGDEADTTSQTFYNSVLRGGRGLLSSGSIFGTHWSDSFTSSTAGVIRIFMNEPTSVSLAQCAANLNSAAGSGFTSISTVSMKTLTDTIEWTMNYYALGITRLANSDPTISATNPANHTFTFQYDLGSGFNGSWLAFTGANLFGIGAINPNTGVKLKVKVAVNTANASNLLSSIVIATVTDATSRQIQYPLPGSIVNVTNLVPYSRVKLTRVDTGAVLQQQYSGAGTSVQFDVAYTGAVLIEARNASGSPAYIPWVTQVSISTTATTNVVALQVADQ